MASKFWVGGTDTWDATAGTKWSTTSGGAGGAAVPAPTDTAFFDANSGSGTVTKSGSVNVTSLDFTGFTGTYDAAGAAINTASNGVITFSAGMTLLNVGLMGPNANGGSTCTITCAGQTVATNCTVSNTTLTFADDFIISGRLGLSGGGGTIVSNNHNVSAGTFLSSSGTRNINMGSGTWSLSGTGTVWDTTTTTGLTLTPGTSTLKLTNSSGTARTITMVAAKPVNNIWISAGTGTVTLTTTACKDFSVLGFSGSLSSTGSNPAISGNLTWDSGATVSIFSPTMSSTSSGKTLTFNGGTFTGTITFNGVGGGWTLQDSFTNGGSTSAGAFVLTAGSLDTNGKTIAASSFNSNGATTRSLTLGASVISLSQNGGTPWSVAATGLTFSGASSTINMNGTSATFAGGSQTYGTVNLNGTGTTVISGDNVFGTLSTAGSSIQTFSFTAASTQTATTFNLSGDTAHLHTLQSSSAGSQWNLSKSSGAVTATYLSLKDSNASGGATFTAGPPATNRGNNTGWNFVDPIGRSVIIPASQFKAPY